MRGCRSHRYPAERPDGVRFVSKAAAGTGSAGHRCAGGGAGLSRAADLVKAGYEHVLLVAVEFCSLTFVLGDESKSNFIGTALFADGGAAAVLGAADESIGGTASGGGGGLHACDRNISANTATTCDFATSVFQSYAAEDQSGASPSTDIVTSSSATAQTYKMSCNYDGSQVTCTGGDNALVTFPKWAADVY